MADENTTPGPRRRRIPGVQLKKRMISVTPEEERLLEARADRAETSVSELLITSTLSPKGAISNEENKRLMTALIDARAELGRLVNLVKNDESTEALDEFMRSAKTTSDALFNAVENLAR